MAVTMFRGLDEKYKVETETKQLYTDLMDARGGRRSGTGCLSCSINGTGYETYEDTSPRPTGTGAWKTADTLVANVTVSHTITTGQHRRRH